MRTRVQERLKCVIVITACGHHNAIKTGRKRISQHEAERIADAQLICCEVCGAWSEVTTVVGVLEYE